MKKLLTILLFLGIMLSPAWAGIQVLSDLTISQNLMPGDKYDGVLLLQNNGDKPADVKLYQNDYLFQADGKNTFGKPGSHTRSNAPWIFLQPSKLTIQAGETASVNYNITVPNDPQLKGTYWSIIMIEPEPEDIMQTPTPEKGKHKMGITTVIRYGLQVVTNIGDNAIRQIDFSNIKLIKNQKINCLQADLSNNGEQWLNLQIWLEIYDSKGNFVAKKEAGKLRIYPGCSARSEISLEGLPSGTYSALLVADNGDQAVFGAQCDLIIK